MFMSPVCRNVLKSFLFHFKGVMTVFVIQRSPQLCWAKIHYTKGLKGLQSQ